MLGVFVPGVIQKNNNMLVRHFMNFLPEVVGDDFKVIDFYKTNRLKNGLSGDINVYDVPIDDIISQEKKTGARWPRPLTHILKTAASIHSSATSFI